MIIFWILAAGLTALSLLFIVPPLLQRRAADEAPTQDALNLSLFRSRLAELDDDLAAGVIDRPRYDAAHRDLERELLHDLHDGHPGAPPPPAAATRAPLLALVLGLVVPTAAVLGYLQLGDYRIIPRIEASAATAGAPAGTAQATQSLEVLAQGLAQRMEQTPDNLDGWLMLARTYFAIEQPAKALAAMERAYRLAPEQPDVMVAYAEALAANAGSDLRGRPAELIAAALVKDPANAGARWLSGTLAYQQGQFAQAAETWQGLLSTLEPGSEDARQVGEMVAAARTKAGLPALTESLPPGPTDGAAPAAAPPAAPLGAEQAAAPSAAGARLEVSVALAPALAAQAAPEDTVFVFARPPVGPPMPLAVKRLRVADLPTTLTLDDSAALIPNLRLSSATEVVVGARVSKRGEATPGSGDLEGETGPVQVSGGGPITVTVERVRP